MDAACVRVCVCVYMCTQHAGSTLVWPQRGALCERYDVPGADGRADKVCFNPAAASLSALRFVTTDTPSLPSLERNDEDEDGDGGTLAATGTARIYIIVCIFRDVIINENRGFSGIKGL